MSYDFRLCLPEPGRTREETANSDSALAVYMRSRPEGDAREQRVAAALLAGRFSLERSDVGVTRTGSVDRREMDELEAKPRPIELNAKSPEHAIQIMLFDREATVTLAYGPRGEALRRSFESIWSWLAIMCREGGYFVFDPQLGRVIDLDGDFEAVLACYVRSVGIVFSSESRKVSDRKPADWLPAELDRRAYLWRWCALSGVVLLLCWVIFRITLNTKMEALVMVPSAGWLICKMLLLDVPRLRSMGWQSRVTFFSLFLPLAVILQVQLFVLPPKRA